MGVVRGTREQQTTATTTALLDAVLELAGDLDIHSLLERFVHASTALTGAQYGAINIVDGTGTSTTFVQSGIDARTAGMLGHPPHAWGVLGAIPDEGALRLSDLTEHPAFRGLPPGHPPMGSFLGAAVRVRGERYGTLYLAEKPGGFDTHDESVIVSLAAAAAVAVQNAELYAIEHRRERWLTAGQAITTMLLEGTDQEEVLLQIAMSARTIDGADACALVLPGRDGELVLEIVTGPRDGDGGLLGLDLSRDPRVRTAFDTGVGQSVESMAAERGVDPALAGYGPALFTPMRSSGHGVGVLVLLRAVGAPSFTPSDLALSQTFASQAALAFVLAEARGAQDQAALHDERGRIARDLHDLAIQQLIAAGMQLESVREHGAEPLPDRVDRVMDSVLGLVDSGVRQIRVIVRALDDPGAGISLVHRVHAEVELARPSLGFAPELAFTVDGVPVGIDGDAAMDTVAAVDRLVAPGSANTVVAVIREGLSNVARHARSHSVAVRVAIVSTPQGGITVEVEDDGVGVPQAPSRASGTKNLAIRAEQVGGTFALVRPPSGRGALLRWTAPLD